MKEIQYSGTCVQESLLWQVFKVEIKKLGKSNLHENFKLISLQKMVYILGSH